MTETDDPHPGAVPAARRADRRIALITAVSAIGALAFGYNTGVIAGALPFMSLGPGAGGLGLSPLTAGVVTSSLVFGAAFGAFWAGRLADALGRRATLLVVGAVLALAALGSALAPTVASMVAFRTVLGLAVGGASVIVPMFIAEFAPVSRRGRLVTVDGLMIVVGQLVAYVSNAVLAHALPEGAAWRVMLGAGTVLGVLLFAGMAFIPESPRWLSGRGRLDEAGAVLRSVRRDPAEAATELAAVHRGTQQAEPSASWRDLRVPWIRRLLMLGIGLGLVAQLTGVNAIVYFAPSILGSSGMGTHAALTAAIATGVCSVAAAALGLWLLGRHGRRTLLLTGLVGAAAGHLLLGLAFLLPASTLRSYLVLALMSVVLFFVQAMVSTMYWLLISEIFPQRLRGFVGGLAVAAQWIVNALVALAFPPLTGAVGGHAFFVFAGINAATLAWARRAVPETRGKSLEQIERELTTRFS